MKICIIFVVVKCESSRGRSLSPPWIRHLLAGMPNVDVKFKFKILVQWLCLKPSKILEKLALVCEASRNPRPWDHVKTVVVVVNRLLSKIIAC